MLHCSGLMTLALTMTGIAYGSQSPPFRSSSKVWWWLVCTTISSSTVKDLEEQDPTKVCLASPVSSWWMDGIWSLAFKSMGVEFCLHSDNQDWLCLFSELIIGC